MNRAYFPISITDGKVALTDAQKFAFVSGMLAGLKFGNKSGVNPYRIGTLYPIRTGDGGGIGLSACDTLFEDGVYTYRIPISCTNVDTSYAGFGIKLSYDASRVSVLSITKGNIGDLSDVFIGHGSCFARCICGDYEVIEGETEAYIKAIEPRTEYNFEQIVCWLTVRVLQAPTVDNPIIFHFEGTNGNDYNASALYHWSYYPEAEGYILSLITPIVNKDFKISGTISQYGTSIDVKPPFTSPAIPSDFVRIGSSLANAAIVFCSINLVTAKSADFSFNRLTFDLSITSDVQAQWLDFVINESEDFIRIFYNNTGTDLTPSVPWSFTTELEYRNGHGEIVEPSEPWDLKIVHVTVSFEQYVQNVKLCLGACRVLIRHPWIEQFNTIMCSHTKIWDDLSGDYIDIDSIGGNIYWPPNSGGGGSGGGGGGFGGYGGGGTSFAGSVFSSSDTVLWVGSDGQWVSIPLQAGWNYVSGFIPTASSGELEFIVENGYIYIPIGFQIEVYPNANAYNLAPNFKIYEQVSFIDDYAIELFIPPVPPAPFDGNLLDEVELEDDYVFVLKPIHTDSLPSIDGTSFEDAYSIDTININIKYKDVIDTIEFRDTLLVEGPEHFDPDSIFEDITYADAYSLDIKRISYKNIDKVDEILMEDVYSVLIEGIIPPVNIDSIEDTFEYIDKLNILSKIIGKKTELNSDSASFNDVFAYNTKRLTYTYKTFADEVNITDVYSIERSVV